MKKILVTRKLLSSNEDKLSNLYEVKLNENDELYSQNKLIELSQDCDGILSSITDKIDKENDEVSEDQNKFLKIVKDITRKGLVRNNYKKNLVDLSDIKINLKGKK